MRRAEKELTDPAALADVLERGRVLHLGMCDGEVPYVVPVNYGFAQGAIFVHSAREGHKLDVISRNPRVCFEVTVDDAVEPSASVCDWSSRFRSVIGFGTARLLHDPDEKAEALTRIVRHYGEREARVDARRTAGVAVLRIDIERMTGKFSEG